MSTNPRLRRCLALALAWHLTSCARGGEAPTTPAAPAASVAAAAPAASAAPPPADRSEPPGLHAVRLVPVATGVNLEVLDWGGSGPPVVLLVGLGGTAHVFDEFAPALTDRFHVYGVTRRGNGRSSVPATGYDLPTLAGDLLHVLDGLGLARASLIGHSAGGEELTLLAGEHPERVDRLVYLDAAYDRTDPSMRPGGDCDNSEPPVEADLVSPVSFRAWFERSRGVRLPEIEARMLFEYHGPPGSAFKEYMPSIRRPDYARVRAPALALYAVPASAADYYPAWARMNEAQRVKAEACFATKQRPGGEAARADFRARVARGKVIEVAHGKHFLFLSNRDEVLAATRAFLTEAR